MSQKVTDEATAAASLHSSVRDNVSYQTFSQLDETCVNTIVPTESSGSEFVKDENNDRTARSGGTIVATDVGFLLKTAGICLAYFFLSFAELTPGLCLVHFSLIFGMPLQQFGIVFLLQAIGGALGALLNAFKITHASYEKQLHTTLTFVAMVTLLCPWFNFVTYCTLLFVSTFASSYALTLGFPYIARVWSDKGYSRETALQLITLIYSLGIVTAPFVIDLFLVALPSDVDDQTCQVALGISALKNNYNLSTSATVVFEDYSDNNMVQAMTPRQVTQQAPITALYNSASSNTEVYSLARWSFAVVSGGLTIAVIMLAVVCLIFDQTPTSTSVDARQTSNNKDSPKTATSIDLVCAMFVTIFFCASAAGSLNLYLQTYAIVGLGWHKSDATHLTVMCAAGQLICRVAIMLSTYASRRPATCVVILLVTGVCGLLLMMVTDLYTAVEAVTVRVGVFVTGAAFGSILPLIFIVIDQNHHLDILKSAILNCGSWSGFFFGVIFAGFLLCDYGSISFVLTLLTCSVLFGISFTMLLQLHRLES